MSKITVLLADNSPDFLAAQAKLLERDGFRVLRADSSSEARRRLENDRTIDIAVLDLRLEDESPGDNSGLQLAREVARTVPKIIITAHEIQTQAQREALLMDVDLDGLPAVVDYISKTDGHEALVRAIRHGLQLARRFRLSLDSLTGQLERNYQDARSQSLWNYGLAAIVSVAGILIVFTGIGLVLDGQIEAGIAATIAGVIAQIITVLFIRRVDVANRRMDNYHSELVQTRRFDNLLAACTQLSARQEYNCKVEVIRAMTSYWFPGPQVPSTVDMTAEPASDSAN